MESFSYFLYFFWSRPALLRFSSSVIRSVTRIAFHLAPTCLRHLNKRVRDVVEVRGSSTHCTLNIGCVASAFQWRATMQLLGANPCRIFTWRTHRCKSIFTFQRHARQKGLSHLIGAVVPQPHSVILSRSHSMKRLRSLSCISSSSSCGKCLRRRASCQ